MPRRLPDLLSFRLGDVPVELLLGDGAMATAYHGECPLCPDRLRPLRAAHLTFHRDGRVSGKADQPVLRCRGCGFRAAVHKDTLILP